MKESDLFAVQQYLLRSVARSSFWREVDYLHKNEAISALHQLPESLSAWQSWIEQWLTTAQQQKLQSSVRKARMRHKGKNITISEQAHHILVVLSENGRLSLSDVIEQKLNRAYQKKIKICR